MVSAVDTDVISALWSQEPTAQQMADLLEDARRRGRLVICAPVFAELLAHPGATESFVEQFLATTGIEVDPCIDESVWRRAATAYATYAQRHRGAGGGHTKRLLVDFIVGAHALLQSDRLLSLDASRHDRDYPDLTIASA